MIEEKVASRIKKLRGKLSISKEELSSRSSVHRTYIEGLKSKTVIFQ